MHMETFFLFKASYLWAFGVGVGGMSGLVSSDTGEDFWCCLVYKVSTSQVAKYCIL